MKISRERLLAEAQNTGFRPEILEKVVHLLNLLERFQEHPFLKQRLALKGGTALNLFLLDLPRLSVDIDLNYIGAVERDTMLGERSKVEAALEAVCSRESLRVVRQPVARCVPLLYPMLSIPCCKGAFVVFPANSSRVHKSGDNASACIAACSRHQSGGPVFGAGWMGSLCIIDSSPDEVHKFVHISPQILYLLGEALPSRHPIYMHLQCSDRATSRYRLLRFQLLPRPHIDLHVRTWILYAFSSPLLPSE